MKIWRFFKGAVALYLIYALVGAALLPALPKKVSEKTKKEFSMDHYLGKGQGPDRVLLVEDPARGFDIRIALISEAKKTLDISTHCVEWGTTAEYFFAALLDAADRGVQIRMVNDGMIGGMRGQKDILYALAQHPNITYYEYNPLDPLRPDTWNQRLHDKYLLCDDRLLLLGGRNIGDKYFNSFGFQGAVSNDRDVLVYCPGSSKESVLPQVRDYMDSVLAQPCTNLAVKKPLSAKQARLASAARGRLADALAALRGLRPELFENAADWAAVTVPTAKVTLVANPTAPTKKEPVIGYVMARLAQNARRSVTLQSPYTVAHAPMRKVFTRVAGQIDDFTLLTNSLASTPNLPAFSNYLGTRGKLLETGVTIKEYQGTDSIHAKAFLMDERLCGVGSMNLDERSLYLDTETMLIIDSTDFYLQLSQAVGEIEARSLTVDQSRGYLPAEDARPQKVSVLKAFLFYTAAFLTRPLGYLI